MDPLQQAIASKDDSAFQAELERRIAALKADKNPADVAAHNAEVTTAHLAWSRVLLLQGADEARRPD